MEKPVAEHQLEPDWATRRGTTKNAVPTSLPVPARSVSRDEVSPPHSAPDSAISAHVPGPCTPSSDPVVRNGHPAFAGCLRAGRCRLLGTAPSVHHIRVPLSRGYGRVFRASVSRALARPSAAPDVRKTQSCWNDHRSSGRPAVRPGRSVTSDGRYLEPALTDYSGTSGCAPARPGGRVRTVS